MKKLISLILTLTMFTAVIYPCQSVIAKEMELQDTLAVGQDIAELCAEYDDYNGLNDIDDKTIDTRLIVKADDSIDKYGAVDSVFGFGYAFLQYADEESAQSAKTQYENLGYTVNYDSMATLCNTNSNNYPQYANWPEEWAYEETDAVSALDYYKLKAKSTINIAVVDSGINYNHELFKNRIVRTKVDFSTDSTNDELDTYDHGTNVTGAIAKSTPSNVKFANYKIFNRQGKTTTSIVLSAFEYIKQLPNKPDIINCSFDTYGLETEIDALMDMGITVVAGAGNDSEEIYRQSVIFNNSIIVAATNYYGKPCSFTNYGNCVDISAPGEYIYTADMSSNSAYTFVNGTSLAAPLVSAACAYVLMEHKNYTPEQVKQELIATATPFKKSDCYYDRYGAGIVNFSNIINGTRCKDVTANYISGAYRDNISVELKCANTLVDIYYTTDGTLPTKTNGTKYTDPIDVTESTRIIAAAYARAGTPFHSKFTYLDYYILKDGESEYVIEKSGYSGIIKAYLGNETNLVVPDIVNGIVPTELGGNIFKNSNIESIVLPDTVDTIGDNAFCNTPLKSITANGICNLNKRCFYSCEQLTDINFPTLKYVGDEALSGCKMLKTINLPECTEVGWSAFKGCAMQEIVLKKASSLGENTFANCSNLETLYIPKATGLMGFDGCTNLQMIFAPMVSYISVDIPNNVTIYCSDKLRGVDFPDEYKGYKYTFISPEYTPGLNEADRDGYTDRFIRVNSDEFGTSKGGQIRTRDNGLRFGFEFDESNIDFDFRKYADTVDYGFVYTYKSYEELNDFQKNYSLRANKNSVLVKSADKRNIDGTVSTYNAVFTNIPKDHLGDKISARAYMNIDGMYFYSPVTTRSFRDVAEKIIADDKIDQGTKDEINDILQNQA